MTTNVDLANRALQAIGTRTTVTAAELAGNLSNEAIQSNIIMTPFRRSLLRMAPWSCAFKTANLVYITSSPGTPENTSAPTTLWQPGQPAPPWSYEYQYPPDCLRACLLIPATQTGFAGGIPITTAVTGGAASFWMGPPVKFKVGIDMFFSASAATLVSGGSGHKAGDIITLYQAPQGSPPVGAPAQVQVDAVDANGTITAYELINVLGNAPNTGVLGTPEMVAGSYFAVQNGPQAQSASTGSGVGASFNLVWNPAPTAPQRVILCNQEFAILSYVMDVVDPNVWDDQFQEAYVQIMGAGLCMALTGDKKLANGLIEQANRMIIQARVGDGNEGLTVNDVTPDWIRARGIAFPEPYSGPFNGADQISWSGMWPIYG